MKKSDRIPMEERFDKFIELLYMIRDSSDENNGMGMKSTDIVETAEEWGITKTLYPVLKAMRSLGIIMHVRMGSNVFYKVVKE
jgi:hypothetical protein